MPARVLRAWGDSDMDENELRGAGKNARILRAASFASRAKRLAITQGRRAVMRRDNKGLSRALGLIYWTCGHIYAKQGQAELKVEPAFLRSPISTAH
ncbi:hypothetical protein DAA61_25045 [Bradyrhizobium sp. WBAH33]|nr:hypothetical protein DAA61_25045 [Bradyrhizobium sp. WBAH33]QCK06168.1 hypothetical protein DAB18_25080 [Bradyrhizobium sp. WBAH41]